MALKFDKDERAVTKKIREYSSIFNEIGNEFKIVSFRADIAELILGARIEERIRHTGESIEDAEKSVLADLEASEV